MTNTHTPSQNAELNTQVAEPQQVSVYKIRTITTTRGCTHDGRTFTASSDLCDNDRALITFKNIRNAERFAQGWAQLNDYKYNPIGSLEEPALGETFVEVGIASEAH